MDVLREPVASQFFADCAYNSVVILLRAVSLAIDLAQLFICERRSSLGRFPEHDLTDFLMTINISFQLGLVETSILSPATGMCNAFPDLHNCCEIFFCKNFQYPEMEIEVPVKPGLTLSPKAAVITDVSWVGFLSVQSQKGFVR